MTPLRARAVIETVLIELDPPLTPSQFERLQDFEKRPMNKPGDLNAVLALLRRGLVTTDPRSLTDRGRKVLRAERVIRGSERRRT
jgi:hypothetical protein